MRRHVRAWATGALGLIVLSACGERKAPEKPPIPVRLQAAEAAGGSAGIRYSANITAKDQVSLAFKEAGYLREIMQARGVDGRPRDLHDGDRVEKGAVLARLRETEYENGARQARSSLAEAQATLLRAKQDFERAEALHSTQSLTQPEYDQAKSQLDVAQARTEGAQAQVQVAQTSLDDCALKAPFCGIITQSGLEVGQLVSPGTVGFVLADTTSVKAVFGVSDVMLAGLKLGGRLSVATESIAGVDFQGQISRIAPSADPKSHVFEVELTIPNADGRLKPGMIAALQVGGADRAPAASDPTASTPAVTLSAIVRSPSDPDGYAVYVVADEGGRPVARVRKVTLGEALGNSIAVTSGLKVGERVIVTGSTLVIDGDPVRIVP